MGSRMSFGGLEPQGQRRNARREGAPPGGWTRPCHGAGGAPWWGPAAIPRRAAEPCSAISMPGPRRRGS